MKKIGILVVVSLLWTGSGLAQVGSGQFHGVCLDAEGAAIPGATVVIKHLDTGIERVLETDRAGRFSAPFLAVGPYEIRAESSGMQPLKLSNLVLSVGAAQEVMLKMSLAGVQNEVTVLGEVPLTTQTEISKILDSVAIQNLPINGRRWENFGLLTPGVTNDGANGLVAFHGIAGIFNNTMVDGADNNQAFFSEERGRGHIAYPISQETVREFQVNSSNYSAEFGRAAGGIVNAVTHSGSEQFHGSAFDYLRDKSFIALDPFARAANQDKPPERRHQFGASVGGPLVRKNVFFFASYDQQDRNFPVTVLPVGGDQFYAGSTAPAAATQQAVNFLRSQTGVFPRKANQNLGYGKVDWQINQDHRWTSSLNVLNFRSPNGIQTASVVSAPVSSNGRDAVKNETSINTLTSALSPSQVNELRFQYSRDFELQTPNGLGPWVIVSNAGGSMQYGRPPFLPRPAYPNEKRFQFMDNFSFLRGAHDFKVGADINVIRDMLVSVPGSGGSYSYSSLTAFAQDFAALNTGTSSGKHYDQFTQTFDSTDPEGRNRFHTTDYNFYVQDRYTVSPKLTVNMGLRYEYQQIEQPKTSNPLLPQTAHLNEDKLNFGPRLGIAWQPANRMMLRAGYGLSFGRTQNSTLSNFYVNNGTRQWIYQQFATFPGAPTFPNVFAGPPSAGVAPITVNLAAPDFVNPAVHQSTLELERYISSNLTVSAVYLMSRGTHLPSTRDTNLSPAATTRSYNVLNSAGGIQGTVSVPFYTTRVNPLLGQLLTYETGVNSWYHALILQASKRYGHDIQLMTSFTWSHSTDDGQSSYNFLPGNVVLDPFNRHADYGNTNFDQRKRFVFSGVWQPTVRAGDWTAGPLFTDWKFSGIVTLADGFPVTGLVESPILPGALGAGLNGSNNTSNRFPGIGRNAFSGPGLSNVDLRIAREIRVTESGHIEILAEAFNFFNRVNYGDVNTTQYLLQGSNLVPNPSFLKPQSALSYPANGSPRQFQFALRFVF